MSSCDWWPRCAGYKFKDSRRPVFRGRLLVQKEEIKWEQKEKTCLNSKQLFIFLEHLDIPDALF